MSRLTDRTYTLISAEAQPLWQATDLLMLGASGVMLVLLAWGSGHGEQRVVLGLGNLAFMLLVFAFAKGARHPAQRSKLVTFVHDWLPGPFILAVYFELGVVIPLVHPFDGYRYDHMLQAVDVRILGDPSAFFLRFGTRWLSDLLTVCYAAYYPLGLLVPVALYARGADAEFRTACAIILSAFVVSYAGYVLFPAVGPHLLFDGPRAAVLDGNGLARRSYWALRAMHDEPPDAFPSGHALVSVLVPALAWRWDRRLFVGSALVSAGIVLATLYLRYHYLLDVLAAFALAPLAWKLGTWLDRRCVESAENMARARSTSER